jgi:hypothetical protein
VVTDQGAGLKSVTATLSVGGTEHSLAGEQYAEPVKEKKLTVAASKIAGLKKGPRFCGSPPATGRCGGSSRAMRPWCRRI